METPAMQPNPRFISRLSACSLAGILLVAALAILALAGWTVGNQLLQSLLPGHDGMKVNTALALLAASVSLALLRAGEGQRRRAGQAFAVVPVIIGLLTLAEYLGGWDLGIDQAIFPQAPPETVFPGRMAFTTTLAVVLLGTALLCLDWETRTRRYRPAEWLTAAAAAISLAAMLGYSYGVPLLSPVAFYTQMAFPTALSLTLLCVAVFFARPARGFAALLAADSSGGAILRRLLPLGIALPWVIGWASMAAVRSGLYAWQVNQVVVTLALVVLFVLLISINARWLDRTDLQRRAVEDELRRSRDEWEMTFNCMSEGLTYHDLDYNIIRSNAAFDRLLGGNCNGEKCYQRVHAADRPPSYCPMARTLVSGRTESGEFYDPHLGRFLSVRTDPVRNEAGQITRVVHVVEDITVRKKAQEKAQQLAAIVQSSDDAIISAALDGTVLTWNDAAQTMYGFAASEIIGQNLMLTCPPERQHETMDILRRVHSGERVQDFETVRLRKQGTAFDASLTASPIRNDRGEIVGASEIARDISERKHAEQERLSLLQREQHARRELEAKKAEVDELNRELEVRVRERTADLLNANRELEAFAYSVSHDLRAPLRSLDGFSQILLDDYRDRLDEEGRDYLQRVRNASQHMGHLIDALLQLSRVSRAELRHELVDLTALAEAVVAELRGTAPQRMVETSIAGGLCARGDARLVQIVLQNLLDNAWKFTSKQEYASIEFGCMQRDGATAYFVRDNGVGFEMEYAGKLFGAFQRLHTSSEFEGSGIGLATVERAVRRHGGRVWAEGAPGKGATFYFTLP
jgi:PAS domain S-box-containing protein